jgi:hypothetical protein
MATNKYLFLFGIFQSKMVWRFGSRRISGQVLPHFENNVLRYIILFITKAILSLLLWKLLLLM